MGVLDLREVGWGDMGESPGGMADPAEEMRAH
jgi:hypothetical protein